MPDLLRSPRTLCCALALAAVASLSPLAAAAQDYIPSEEARLYDELTSGAAPWLSIDPLAPDAGGFLDFNASLYLPLASASYSAEDYTQCAQILLYILRYDVANSELLYLLACCYGRMNDSYLAARTLERAGRAGFADLARLAQEPAFAALRGDDLFDRSAAQLAENCRLARSAPGELTGFTAPTLLPLRIVLPADYDPQQAYPLLLGLHGHGSDATWFARAWAAFDSPQFIYAVPQAPYPAPAAEQLRAAGIQQGFSWHLLTPAADGTLQADPQSVALSEEYLEQLLAEIKSQYKISAVYALGFSQGGMVAYRLGILRPGLLTGVLCFGSLLPDALSDAELTAGSRLKVFIAHGVQDSSLPLIYAQAARDRLKAAGYSVTYLEYAGGHGLSVEALKAGADWLVTQSALTQVAGDTL